MASDQTYTKEDAHVLREKKHETFPQCKMVTSQQEKSKNAKFKKRSFCEKN